MYQLGETTDNGGFQGAGLNCPQFYSLGLLLFIQQACFPPAALFKERYWERGLTESAVDSLNLLRPDVLAHLTLQKNCV